MPLLPPTAAPAPLARPGVSNPYGFTTSADGYSYSLSNDPEKMHLENIRRYIESQELLRANLNYENSAQRIYNQMADQQANQQMASLGLNFAGDAVQRQMALQRAGLDLIQQQNYLRNQERGAEMDVARMQRSQRDEQQGLQQQVAARQYGMRTSEVPSSYRRARSLYNF